MESPLRQNVDSARSPEFLRVQELKREKFKEKPQRIFGQQELLQIPPKKSTRRDSRGRVTADNIQVTATAVEGLRKPKKKRSPTTQAEKLLQTKNDLLG